MWLISTFFCLFQKSFPVLVYGSRFETYRTEADYSLPLPFCSLVSVFFRHRGLCFVHRLEEDDFLPSKAIFLKTMFTIFLASFLPLSLLPHLTVCAPRALESLRITWEAKPGDRRGRETKLFRNWNRLILSLNVESALWGFEGGGKYGCGPSFSPSLVLNTRSLANIFISFFVSRATFIIQKDAPCLSQSVWKRQ